MTTVNQPGGVSTQFIAPYYVCEQCDTKRVYLVTQSTAEFHLLLLRTESDHIPYNSASCVQVCNDLQQQRRVCPTPTTSPLAHRHSVGEYAMACAVSKRQAMTRNLCNQNHGPWSRPRNKHGKQQKYQKDIMQREQRVNCISSSFQKGGHSAT